MNRRDITSVVKYGTTQSDANTVLPPALYLTIHLPGKIRDLKYFTQSLLYAENLEQTIHNADEVW